MKLKLAAIAAAAFVTSAAAQSPVPVSLQTFDAAWSIINTTYYDETFRGVDWKAVRDEFRPQAERAATPAELRATIEKMMDRLGESHFAVLPQGPDPSDSAHDSLDRSGDPGFDVRADGDALLVTHVRAGSPAAAHVRAGDRLMAIAGTPASMLGARIPADLEPRVRGLEIWRAAMMRLRGPIGSQLDLTLASVSGATRTVTIERMNEPGASVLLGNLPPMKLDVETAAVETPAGASAGLVRFNVWMAGADAPIAAAIDRFRTARGIVIDLRGNPGGLAGMIMGISGHFFDERKELGRMKTRTNPGGLIFYANPRRSTADGRSVEPYDGPVAILVDGLTGSASECFAGGMQSVGRARVFGETSMGQALPASFTRLPNGDTLLHAIADFVTADGTRLEGRGVVPDEIVPMDRKALADGRDPVLGAALAWIDRQAGPGQRDLKPAQPLW